MSTRATGIHLTEALRAELSRLLDERPAASAAQIAAIFLARTGRKINRSSIDKRRKQGPYKGAPKNGHLGESDRAALARLLADSDGEAGYREIAGQFRALTGRSVRFQSVWRFAVEVLGLPRIGKGNRPRLRTAALARRIDAASAGKLARAKFDRTPRVGRQGRVRLEGGGSC